MIEPPEPTTDRPTPVIADAFRRGRAVFFLGSGVHAATGRPDTYSVAGGHLPLGKELSTYLAHRAGFPLTEPYERENLIKVASYYEAVNERGNLNADLCEIFDQDYPPGKTHDYIAHLHHSIDRDRALVVLTTNYDDVMERLLWTQQCASLRARADLLESLQPDRRAAIVRLLNGDQLASAHERDEFLDSLEPETREKARFCFSPIRPFDVLVHAPRKNDDVANSILVWSSDTCQAVSLSPGDFDYPFKAGGRTLIYKLHGSVVRRWIAEERAPLWGPVTAPPVDWGNKAERKDLVYLRPADHDPAVSADYFLITDKDYVGFLAGLADKSRVPATLLLHVQSRSILFLGYSLEDWNYRVLFEAVRDRTPYAFWSVQFQPNACDRELLRARRVRLYDRDINGFIEELSRL